jgi:hypothetical protein
LSIFCGTQTIYLTQRRNRQPPVPARCNREIIMYRKIDTPAEPVDLLAPKVRHLPRIRLSRRDYWRALLKLFADLTWRFR